MTSLDELLSRDRSGPEPDRSPATRHLRWAVKAVLAAAALGAALMVVLLVLGFSLWYPLAVATVLAGLLLHRTAATLGTGPARPRPAARLLPEPDPGQTRTGLAPAVDRWQARLQWDRAGLWRSSRTLGPSLAELVDERLRQRHGCTRASDPDRARALLGERLWRYLADPAARTPPPRELAALLTTVEAL